MNIVKNVIKEEQALPLNLSRYIYTNMSRKLRAHFYLFIRNYLNEKINSTNLSLHKKLNENEKTWCLKDHR